MNILRLDLLRVLLGYVNVLCNQPAHVLIVTCLPTVSLTTLDSSLRLSIQVFRSVSTN